MILAVETTGQGGGVALLAESGASWTRDLGERGRHAENLIPAVSELLVESGSAWGALRLVAVGVGPGSFTGIRVGIAVTLGLQEALGIPAAGLASLDIASRACYDAIPHPTGGYIIPAAVVRKGEVVMSRFVVDPEGPRRMENDRLVPLGTEGEIPEATTLTGDAASALWPGAPGIRRWVGSGPERALAAARLGLAAWKGGGVEPPVPRYARPPGVHPRRVAP